MKRVIVLAALLTTTCVAFGRDFKLLYTFRGAAHGDGARPQSRLLLDASSNLYGTTNGGGNPNGTWCTSYGCGTVFELSPNAGGLWSESVIYAFCPPATCGNDGVNPTSGLVADGAGNLYGTTSGGGSRGLGTVYELSPPAAPGGAWTEKVLLSFSEAGSPNSCIPTGDLIFDASGNLFGTTSSCGVGKDAAGTVFELSPSVNGIWTETLLYTFTGSGAASPGGIIPEGGVIFDGIGNLYGTTSEGGKLHGGGVFELSPNGDATWTETVIQPFSGNSGLSGPMSGLTFDAMGNLHGSTEYGGPPDGSCFGCGGTYELTKTGNGWKGTPSYLNGVTGKRPAAGVLVDPATQIVYGTSSSGGKFFLGSVFAVQASGVILIHSFCSNLLTCTDGQYPQGGLTEDQSGNMYGTTESGGRNGLGVV